MSEYKFEVIDFSDLSFDKNTNVLDEVHQDEKLEFYGEIITLEDPKKVFRENRWKEYLRTDFV